MILLLLFLWKELLLNDFKNKKLFCAFFYPSVMRLTSLQYLFLQTNHLRKFLEFRVGMGIVDNMVAKCKSVIGVVLVQQTDLI
jgi:hypothetical protein